MQLSFLIAKALLEGDFASYFASVPSAADDPEPIVVREVEATAEADAQACERWIRTYGWEPVAENGSWRICGLDTTAPAFKERDGSGRFVYEFDVRLTVVRSL